MTKTLVHSVSALLGIVSAAAVIVLMAVVVTTLLSVGTLGSSAGPSSSNRDENRMEVPSGAPTQAADLEVLVPASEVAAEERPES